MKLHLTALLSIIATIVPISTASLTYELCPNFEQHIQVNYLSITPETLKTGMPVNIHVNATLDKDIQKGAYVNGTAKYFFITVPIKKHPVCAENEEEGLDCPVKAGQYDRSETFTMPDDLPEGTYDLHLEAYNNDNSPLFCIDTTLTLD